VAPGTDDSGSVRIPAAYCGIVGFKACYGLVPIRGIIPGFSSLNHCGPLTGTVEDAAIMLNSMAGYDGLDITSVEHRREDYATGMRQLVKDLRLGMPVGRFDKLQPDVGKAVMEAINLLGTMTTKVRDMALPPWESPATSNPSYWRFMSNSSKCILISIGLQTDATWRRKPQPISAR
jgi:aspartyl-tRNA(Asn)/glutamyl-tRNA(Gln) amidotransferase subunit A